MKKRIIVWLFVQGIIANALYAAPLDQYLQKLYHTHVIPGFSVVVVRNDQVIFEKGYGTRYIDNDLPMTATTATATGSLAKSFTALAIMQLAEQGKVRLDDPVIKYLPWFHTANREMSDQITIRMLLNNTSGLSAPVVRNRNVTKEAAKALAQSLGSVYLTVPPGTRYLYSNEGFALAGLVIERVTGLPYPVYLQEKIFKPLHMDRTSNNPRVFDSLDVLYGHYPGIGTGIPAHSFTEDVLTEYVAAGSLLRSTARDLGHYVIALLNEGKYNGTQIITPASIAKMWTPYTSFPGISIKEGGNDLPFHYGMGWFTGTLDGKEYVFHGGDRGSMSSMTMLYPEKKIGVVILANIELTAIDRYRYPNLINIANNMVRLSLGEKTTDFAIPRGPDPYSNNFLLPDSLHQRYTGDYLITEGNDWLYLGSRLTIAEMHDTLIGTIRKNDQIIDQFVIDFITRKAAVTRNIMMPRKVYFKFVKERISGVFIGDKKYSRLSEGYYSQFHYVSSPDRKVGFLYPVEWNIEWTEKLFHGKAPLPSHISVTGGFFRGTDSPVHYLHTLFPGQNIIFTGQQLSEIAGSHYWQEMAVVTQDGSDSSQHMVFITTTGKQSFVIIVSTMHDLTGTISRMIPPLLQSFFWQENDIQ